jgi:hypothetical protein
VRIKQRSTTQANRSQSSPSELDALGWNVDLWGGCCQLSSSRHTHFQCIQQLLSRGVIHEGTESTCYPHDDDNPRRNRVYLLPTRRRRHSRKRSLIRIGQPDLYSVTGGVFLLSSRGSFLSPTNTRNFPNRCHWPLPLAPFAFSGKLIVPLALCFMQ